VRERGKQRRHQKSDYGVAKRRTTTKKKKKIKLSNLSLALPSCTFVSKVLSLSLFLSFLRDEKDEEEKDNDAPRSRSPRRGERRKKRLSF
jgi:hypothetical protein